MIESYIGYGMMWIILLSIASTLLYLTRAFIPKILVFSVFLFIIATWATFVVPSGTTSNQHQQVVIIRFLSSSTYDSVTGTTNYTWSTTSLQMPLEMTVIVWLLFTTFNVVNMVTRAIEFFSSRS